MSNPIESALILKEANVLLGASCHFILGTDKEPFHGGECFVFAVEDEAHIKIALRIPRSDWVSARHIKAEVDLRKAIEGKSITGVQELVGFNLSSNNYLGSPYLALRWADGLPLEWSTTNPREENSRRDIICAVARLVVDLLAVQKLGCSARGWMNTKINRKIERVRAGTLSGVSIEECEEQRRLADEYLPMESETTTHVLVHGDLNGNNIIIDDKQKFTSVIDFGQAEMLPLSLAAAYPTFLTHEPTQQDKSINWAVRDTEIMQKDRSFYLSCVQNLAAARGGVVEEYYKLLAQKNEINKYWWYIAASQKNIHMAMAACNWTPPVQYT